MKGKTMNIKNDIIKLVKLVSKIEDKTYLAAYFGIARALVLNVPEQISNSTDARVFMKDKLYDINEVVYVDRETVMNLAQQVNSYTCTANLLYAGAVPYVDVLDVFRIHDYFSQDLIDAISLHPDVVRQAQNAAANILTGMEDED